MAGLHDNDHKTERHSDDPTKPTNATINQKTDGASAASVAVNYSLCFVFLQAHSVVSSVRSKMFLCNWYDFPMLR